MNKWAYLDAEYIDKRGEVRKVFDPHAGQLPMMGDPSRFLCCICGRRLGKSHMCGHDPLIPEALYTKEVAGMWLEDGKRREFWTVGPKYCMDDQTEALTQRGWMRWDEITDDDVVLSIDESGSVNWSEIQSINVFHCVNGAERDVVRVKMRGHDSLSTPEHRWLVEYTSSNRDYSSDGKPFVLGTRFITSEELGEKCNEQIVCARALASYPEPKYTDALVELVAWYWTEGYYRGPGIEITESITVNPDKWISIKDAMISVFGEFTVHGDGSTFYVKGSQSSAITEHCIGKAKILDPAFIMSLTKAQLELFIQTSVFADGHDRSRGRKGRERIVHQRLKPNMDTLQMACSLAGVQSTLAYDERADMWKLAIYERNRIMPASAKRSGKISREKHDGAVWCPTTKTGTWLARRNGTVYFTGNSDAEKTFRVFYNKCKALEIPFDKPGTYYSPGTSSPMIVSLWDGAFIYQAKSSQDPDSLVGEGLSGVHLDEAAKMKEIVWTQMLLPTLADFKGWARFTTTPEGKNWIYDLYTKAINPKTLDWNGFRIPSWKNPHVYSEPTVDEHVKRLIQLMEENPGLTSFEIITAAGLIIDPELAQAVNSLTPATLLQEYGAEFTDFVGKVFKGFDEETHVRPLEWMTQKDGWETVAAVDYGMRNPNVWLLIQIGPWGEINIFQELYQEDLAPDEFAQEILRRGLVPDECHSFYPDPALPGYTKTLETMFFKAGKRCRARSHTGGEINDRLNLIRAVIKNRMTDNVASAAGWQSHPTVPDKKRPQLLVNPVCTKTIYEFSEYRYPEKKAEAETSTKRYDLPMKKDDHTPEAFGRMMASRYHDHATQMGGGGTRVSKANFTRSMGRRAPEGLQPAGIRRETLPKRRGGWASNR